MNAKIKIILAAVACAVLLGVGLWFGFRAGDARGRAVGDAERSALDTQLIEQGRILGHFEAALNNALEREQGLSDRIGNAQSAGFRIAKTAGGIVDRAGRIKFLADGIAEVVRLLAGDEQPNP
ncbi:MAG: hypothetical protein WC820_01565 [Spirochaetales bacterium]